MDDVFVVSIEAVDGRYWTIMDDREHVGPWILRTLERLTEGVRSGCSYQPRVTQFAKLN